MRHHRLWGALGDVVAWGSYIALILIVTIAFGKVALG